MRNRAWRRAQDRRVIRKRLGIVKNFWRSDYEHVPGHLRKWNFTCSCSMCRMSGYYEKIDKHKREDARSTKFSDYA